MRESSSKAVEMCEDTIERIEEQEEKHIASLGSKTMKGLLRKESEHYKKDSLLIPLILNLILIVLLIPCYLQWGGRGLIHKVLNS